MKGRIFDIQRFSVHDGPGIRTTVFMKGCPLRCRWCHNPEGLSKLIELRFFEDKCISCRRCGLKNDLSDADKCPAGALTVCGKDVDTDDVIAEIKKDMLFYGDNGGVTCSGGECLLQPEFVAEVLEKAKLLGLHTAIDTSGYVTWESFEKTMDVCDLYLYDIKCLCAEKHLEFTGVNNGLILQNLKKLCSAGKEIWIRIPVIPDFNDNIDEMEAIALFLSDLDGIKQVTLMPYHTLGASKYRTLGLEYCFDVDKKISTDMISEFGKIFESKHFILK